MDSKHIYKNLCKSRKALKENHVPGSGLHRHHITPKHVGGADAEDNYTYLTVREHILAHYLLWRIYKNSNDLRSMKMLGANLTVQQRRQVGLFCKENEIGVFSKEYRSDFEANSQRCRSSALTQKELSIGTFDPEKRKEISSMGGKVGGRKQKENAQGIHDPTNFKKYASLGGKAIKGMICVTNGKHRTRIKPDKLDDYLSAGYVKGFKLFSDI